MFVRYRRSRLIHCSLICWTTLSFNLSTTYAQTCVPPISIDPHKVIDFTICYTNITTLNTTVFNDPIEYTRWNNSGCFRGDPRNLVLTVSGCKLICGTGYTLWNAKDTFSRIGLWIVPALVLLGRLSFPLLDWKNCPFVICHVIGDPIDSLWSLITRYEVHRWLKRRVHAIPKLIERQAKWLTEICIAYEQFGWTVTTPEFFEKSCLSETGLPNASEWKIIEEAALQLRNTRVKAVSSALNAIATLILSLVGAILQTISRIEQSQTRINIEVAHTIAVVCLLFFSIPLVWFSAKVGTYTSVAGPIHIIKNMRSRLAKDERLQPLFPELPLVPSAAPGGPPIPITEINWPIHASYYGVHSFWRPSKYLPADTSDYHDNGGLSSSFVLRLSVSWVVFGACVPAIFLSATNHATDIHKIGYGCRALTWTVILTLWVLSFLSNILITLHISRQPFPLHSCQCNAIKLQRKSTVRKDFFFACAVVIGVLLVQFGVWNSCYCRSSWTGGIDLMGYTNLQWITARVLWAAIPSTGLATTGALIFWIEKMGGRKRRSWLRV